MILHIRYTARQGGDLNLTQAAKANLAAVLPAAGLRLLVLNDDFASEWHRFLHPDPGTDQTLRFTLAREHAPFYARGKPNIHLTAVNLIVGGAPAASTW